MCLWNLFKRSTGRVGLPRPTRPVEITIPLYNSYDARTFFAQLLDRVCEGEEIAIGRRGQPIAKLVRYEGEEPTRPGVIRTQLVLHARRASA
jgi:antitoxin (DNA-binding transcriptional repressor) of toxin-antitoxin stability system